MTAVQYAFALEYLANGGNATAAYRKDHPQASDAVCQVEGWRYLRIHKVEAFVQREVQKRLAARQADGDALLGLVIGEAFSDVRQLFDHNGALLKPQDWPDSIVNCIEGVEVREDRIRVKLTSKAQAFRFLLELLGRTHSTAASIDHLAEAIRADRAKHVAPLAKR